MANIYDIIVKDMEGKDVSLSEYKGKVLLIVNTATGCGFTPQYSGLEAMYRKYKEQGFEILDFPCNQFFGQAPGSDEEIHSFCQLKYDVSFKQFHKIDVNGKNEDPLYTYLKSQKKGRIKWNFAKFLIDREGNVVNRYGSMSKPEAIEPDVEKLL
ncbi:MAG: glutathione peroxidase [Erysipelotrichaceae bacterium]|jgi:glutathione peroxidase|nr:glutathione peroxidase [Erysipelotrichaceae bacterium]